MESLFGTLRLVVKRFEDGGLPYMIVGSIASSVYGDPRLTHDFDFVVELDAVAARRLPQLFPFEEFYCPPVEVLEDEVRTSGQFNLIHHASGLKVDIVVRKSTPHGVEEFARRIRIALTPDFFAFLAAPEDVILKKLVFFREGGSEKHLRDIRGILAGAPTDATYLQTWIERLGLESAWARVAV